MRVQIGGQVWVFNRALQLQLIRLFENEVQLLDGGMEETVCAGNDNDSIFAIGVIVHYDCGRACYFAVHYFDEICVDVQLFQVSQESLGDIIISQTPEQLNAEVVVWGFKFGTCDCLIKPFTTQIFLERCSFDGFTCSWQLGRMSYDIMIQRTEYYDWHCLIGGIVLVGDDDERTNHKSREETRSLLLVWGV